MDFGVKGDVSIIPTIIEDSKSSDKSIDRSPDKVSEKPETNLKSERSAEKSPTKPDKSKRSKHRIYPYFDNPIFHVTGSYCGQGENNEGYAIYTGLSEDLPPALYISKVRKKIDIINIRFRSSDESESALIRGTAANENKYTYIMFTESEWDKVKNFKRPLSCVWSIGK